MKSLLIFGLGIGFSFGIFADSLKVKNVSDEVLTIEVEHKFASLKQFRSFIRNLSGAYDEAKGLKVKTLKVKLKPSQSHTFNTFGKIEKLTIKDPNNNRYRINTNRRTHKSGLQNISGRLLEKLAPIYLGGMVDDCFSYSVGNKNAAKEKQNCALIINNQ